MNGDTIRSQDERLLFFGKVTASISHELNNVFAIVNEQAGLQDDLLDGVKKDGRLDPNRILAVCHNVQKQIRRGEEIVRRLNRFAHTVDDAFSEFDLRDVVKAISAIAQRFASLKNVRLQIQNPDRAVPATGNRFLVQFVFFTAIDWALNRSSEDSSLSISLRDETDEALVSVRGCGVVCNDDVNDRMCVLTDWMNQLKGRMETSQDEGGAFSLDLHLPKKNLFATE